MTEEKKFKQRVHALSDTEGISYMEAHRRLSRTSFYRTELIITDHDGYETDRKVVDLSRFPRTGELVGLKDGTMVEVWHPVVKASREQIVVTGKRDPFLPGILAYQATMSRRPTVREVVGDVHAPLVHMQLHPEVCPGGVWRYLTRPLVEGDGVDIEMPDSLGRDMFGHHVYITPSGFYLKRETLEVEYSPNRRYRLPPHATAA